MIAVRRARAQDADAIGRVHVEAWRSAYGDLMSAEFLDGLDPVARGRRWRAMLTGEEAWSDGLAVDVFVAVRGGALAGFVVVGQSRDEDADEHTAELHAINVAAEHWGSGVGPALFEAAVGHLRSSGHRAVTLWVLEGNARARRFYERYGWTPDGRTKPLVIAGEALTEVRYRSDM